MLGRLRRLHPAAIVALVVAVLLAGGAAWYFFAPKPEEHRQDALEGGASAYSVVKEGAFQDGAPLHHASGTVRLLRDAQGAHLLRFEGYDATPGPDVYFYLTPKAHADTRADVEEAGLLVRTDGMMGQATLRGDFTVKLPDDLDPTAYAGVVAWCRSYDVLFGSAAFA